MHKRVLFFVGTAGSGKSYIAKQLAALVDADYISSGDVARSLPGVHKDLAEGGLYHDDVPILDAVRDFINAPQRAGCIIVDGVPRNENQVHWLVKFANTEEDKWAMVYVDALLGSRLRRIMVRARDEHDRYETVVLRLAKDLVEMDKVYNTATAIFGLHKVVKVMSEKDGDVSAEIATIMDVLHGL